MVLEVEELGMLVETRGASSSSSSLWVVRDEAFLVISFFLRGEAFFTEAVGGALDFKVRALVALIAGVFLGFCVIWGVAFNFLIGVFFVSDLEMAFLALLFKAGDSGAAMALWSSPDCGRRKTVMNVG